MRTATNAEVWHQPGHEEISEVTELVETRFEHDLAELLHTEISEFPGVKRRIDKRLALPWIYGDTLNWMRGLGHMLYRYIGPERLRLVELVRHPVATCRSMLAEARRTATDGTSDLALAEETALRWLRQYRCIRYQLHAIGDPEVWRTIRLEDTGLEQIRELYDFLGLEGYDAGAARALLDDRSREVRNQHRPDSSCPASREELRAIWRVCEPLAGEYGYREDESYYADAPSRPVREHAVQPPPPTEERPTSVKLFDYRGLGLIVKCPSGIRYVNQAGGPICFWAQAEGSFVPLDAGGPGSPAQRLYERFSLRRDKTFMSGIREPDADFIDRLLFKHGMGNITVNRSRIGETWDLFAWESWRNLFEAPWEAWVPVRVAPAPYSRLSGVLSTPGTLDAVLVWENSN